MNAIPQIVPVSELRMKHIDVFGMLANGPVVLAQRSKPAAVLVSIEQWDTHAALLEELRDLVDVLEARLAFSQSGEKLEEFDADEFPALADAVPAKVVSKRQAPVATPA